VSADWLFALAGAGGAAIVNAVMTDAWAGARDRYARLFGRGDPQRQRQAEQRLDETAAAIAAATPDRVDELRRQAADVWRGRLVALLDEHPEARAEVAELVHAAPPATSYTANIHGDGTTSFQGTNYGRQYRIGNVRFSPGGLVAVIVALVLTVGGGTVGAALALVPSDVTPGRVRGV
jgi:hypothetical protein